MGYSYNQLVTLHTKALAGEILTEAQEDALEAWYDEQAAAQDAEEEPKYDYHAW